ncbi:MAG: hypothetical protein HW414_1480 [Dehalococcoidia bacterium]|nr:hypothetical protein [Dehalococcoidia bacterium]
MKWKPYYTRYLGFTAVIAGGGLMLEHYITYGLTLHYWPVDHGLVGLVLVVAGALAAGGRRGENTRR